MNRHNEKKAASSKKLKLYRESSVDEGELKNHVFFKLTGEMYAIGIECVQEILKPKEITEIPRTPDYLCGIVNLRGRIVPVVDLRTRMGMKMKEIGRSSRIIIIRHGDEPVGLLVDEVLAVRPVPENKIEFPSSNMAGGETAVFIKGLVNMDGVVVILLDAGKILDKRHSTGKSLARI